MAVKEILLLGNPVLRQKCSLVKNTRAEDITRLIEDLRDTLQDFRRRKSFGRGIAAPQIGMTQRVIYLDFEYSGALINPKIVQRSSKKFSLWDDCFSFPDILVYVRRNYGITVSFIDESGKTRKLKAEGSLSELLQHEVDHVNGILAIDRAMDSKHIVLRSEFDKLSHKSQLTL